MVLRGTGLSWRIMLGACDAECGTQLAYAAMGCAVLSERTVVPGQTEVCVPASGKYTVVSPPCVQVC
eukprot:965855-Rhodomonas_salina.4